MAIKNLGQRVRIVCPESIHHGLIGYTDGSDGFGDEADLYVNVDSGHRHLVSQIYLQACDPPVDSVNHPPHYKTGGIEVIDFIEAKGLDFKLGNAVKYISRAGKKDGSPELEDLKKARWYLERRIAELETGGGK